MICMAFVVDEVGEVTISLTKCAKCCLMKLISTQRRKYASENMIHLPRSTTQRLFTFIHLCGARLDGKYVGVCSVRVCVCVCNSNFNGRDIRIPHTTHAIHI